MNTGWAMLICVLATWRLCHLVASEDGPFDMIAGLRQIAGNGIWGRLMDCHWCLSIWFAIPFATWMAQDIRQAMVLWLAISAGSCLTGQLSALLDAMAAPPVIELPPPPDMER
jgi:Protein of unknown function (DUF1360)